MSIDSMVAALSAELPATEATVKEMPQTVCITSIVLDPALWVRCRLDDAAVRRYRDVIRAGGELPPIVVARVDGALFLADGWHRLEAHRHEHAVAVTAVVRDMKRAQVKWVSAEQNMRHGVQLKKSERRRVLTAYVSAGRHRIGRGKYKTYREMGSDLGMPFSTLRNWMRADHPDVYNAIGDKCPTRSGPPEPELYREELEKHYLLQARMAMDNARGMAAQVAHPALRGQLVALAEASLAELKAKPYTNAPPEDDNPNF